MRCLAINQVDIQIIILFKILFIIFFFLEKALALFQGYLNGSIFNFNASQSSSTGNNNNNNNNNDNSSANVFFAVGLTLGIIVILVIIYLTYVYYKKGFVFHHGVQGSSVIDQSEHTDSPIDHQESL